MKRVADQRGATLILVMLLLLIFLTMIVGFSYDTRSQSMFTAGVKLNGYYRTTANEILNEIRATLADYWVVPLEFKDVSRIPLWRFGALLQGDFSTNPITSEYGVLLAEGKRPQNAGLLDLPYRVWVGNNTDDPAYQMDGMQVLTTPEPVYVATNWDTDGKMVMTCEIYESDDFSATPPPAALVTVSQMVAVSGSEKVATAGEVATEGGYDPAGLGQGTLGTKSSLTLGDDVARVID